MEYLAALLVGALGVVWIFVKGLKSGEESADLKSERTHRQQREKADEADKDVGSLSADERRQRMRDNYRR